MTHNIKYFLTMILAILRESFRKRMYDSVMIINLNVKVIHSLILQHFSSRFAETAVFADKINS